MANCAIVGINWGDEGKGRMVDLITDQYDVVIRYHGVAVDCESLWSEMEDVRAKGVSITPENLKISDRASLLLPWHRLLDGLEEARLKDKKYGSTKQGIAPFYSDKFQKKTIQAGEFCIPST